MSSIQQPISSGFSAHSTAQEVLDGRDLAGKVAIVTGGYSGLGLAMTRALSAAGVHVVVPARSAEKAREALSTIAGTEEEMISLEDPDSIDGFAARFLDSGRPLDILINSAGIMASPLQRDARGREMQLAVNHLGHFRLAARLAPALRNANGARVVSMSSRAHRISRIDFEDPNFDRRPYDPWVAYGQSKTANALFALGLDQRSAEYGVRAFSVHPGSILTELARFLSREQIASFGTFDENGEVRIDPDRDLKSVEQGAATALWCASDPRLSDFGGVYCENCNIAPLTGTDSTRPEGVRPWAADPEAAERLWAVSVDLEQIGDPWT